MWKSAFLALALILNSVFAFAQGGGGSSVQVINPNQLPTITSPYTTDLFIVGRGSTLYAIACSNVTGVTCSTPQSITPTNPGGSIYAGGTFTLSGTYSGSSFTGVDISFDNQTSWATCGSPTIGGGTFSCTVSVTVSSGSHTLYVREGSAHSVIGGPTNAFTVLAPNFASASAAGTAVTSSTTSVTITYNGSAPSTPTFSWGGSCPSTTGSMSGFSASGGTASGTVTTPASGCTGAITVTGTGANIGSATTSNVVVSATGFTSASTSSSGTINSTLVVTINYTGLAPSGFTYSWNSTCSGTGTATSFSASGGVATGTISTPASTCAGTITVTGTGSNTGVATTASVTISGASYVGPGDAVSGASRAYGMQAATVALASAGAKSIVLCDHTGTANCADLIFGSNGLPTGTLVRGSDNCGVLTTCLVSKIYEQFGSGDDVSATGGSPTAMAAFTPNAVGSVACLTANTNTNYSNYISANFANYTITSVAKRTSTAGYSGMFVVGNGGGNINFGYQSGASNSALMTTNGGTNYLNLSTTDNAFHFIGGVFNSASSFITVDGTNGTPGNAGSNAFTNALNLLYGSSGTGFIGIWCETPIWPAVKTSGNMTTLHSNAATRYPGGGF